MRKKFELLFLGGVWGFIITSVLSSIGESSPADIITWWDAVRVLFGLGVIGYFAIETYRSIKE